MLGFSGCIQTYRISVSLSVCSKASNIQRFLAGMRSWAQTPPGRGLHAALSYSQPGQRLLGSVYNSGFPGCPRASLRAVAAVRRRLRAAAAVRRALRLV